MPDRKITPKEKVGGREVSLRKKKKDDFMFPNPSLMSQGCLSRSIVNTLVVGSSFPSAQFYFGVGEGEVHCFYWFGSDRRYEVVVRPTSLPVDPSFLFRLELQ